MNPLSLITYAMLLCAPLTDAAPLFGRKSYAKQLDKRSGGWAASPGGWNGTRPASNSSFPSAAITTNSDGSEVYRTIIVSNSTRYTTVTTVTPTTLDSTATSAPGSDSGSGSGSGSGSTPVDDNADLGAKLSSAPAITTPASGPTVTTIPASSSSSSDDITTTITITITVYSTVSDSSTFVTSSTVYQNLSTTAVPASTTLQAVPTSLQNSTVAAIATANATTNATSSQGSLLVAPSTGVLSTTALSSASSASASSALSASSAPSSAQVTSSPSASSSAAAASSSATTASSSSSAASSSALPSGTISGKATFYTPGLGACGDQSTDSDLVVALQSSIFEKTDVDGNSNKNTVCGQKIRVTYQDKSVDVTVVDECPGCSANGIDLSPSAFDTLANADLGVIDVTWSFL